MQENPNDVQRRKRFNSLRIHSIMQSIAIASICAMYKRNLQNMQKNYPKYYISCWKFYTFADNF